MDNFIDSGSYHNYSELIKSAVENLAVLQRSVGDGGSIALAPDAVASGDSSPVPASAPARTPGLFECPHQLTAAPGSIVVDSVRGEDAIRDMIFGQKNRLLTLKATCRGVANLSTDGAAPLADARQRISEAAAEFGERLRHLDEERNHDRDEAFATAFPGAKRSESRKSVADTKQKAMDRFANQFVGYLDREDRLQGLPADYALLGRLNDDSERIALSDAGWEFATIPNELMDLDDAGAPKLTSNEQSFLRQHVLASVPREADAFRAILGAIEAGGDSPSNLDAELRRLLVSDDDEEITDAFLTTQRSGAVARAIDLGLIVRRRSGLHVTYEVTSVGKVFLDE